MGNERNARFCDNNFLDKATNVAPESSRRVFSNALDLANRNRIYKPGTKSFSIEIDTLSNSTNLSFFTMLAASNDYFKMSNSASVQLRGNSIKLFTGSEPFSQSVNVGELGAYLNLADSDNPDGLSYRFWQIDIDDSSNPDDIEIAYMYFGDHTIINRNISNGFNYTVVDRTLRGVSDAGKVFSLRKPEQTVIASQNRQIMSEQDKINIINMGRRVGLHTPFIYVIDPDECNTNYDFSVRAVYFDRQVPSIKQIVNNYYSASYALREVI